MLKNIWFTDESCFFADGIAQKSNKFYWALSKDSVKPVIFQKYPIKIHVWSAISASGIIGPYFFHRNGSNVTVNQHAYQDCIKWFIKQLKKQRKFSTAIIMQDGATPHTALSTREFLKQAFGRRIIGKHFSDEWPAQSPDLTPADYYLWPQLKNSMYNGPNPYRSVRALKAAVTHHMNQMKRWDHRHLIASVEQRWRWCVAAKGERLNKYINGQAL